MKDLLMFPSPHPFPFTVHIESLRLATPEVHASWQRAFAQAYDFLPTANPRLLEGKLVLTSPRSGSTYTCTRRACTCRSCACRPRPVPCWPRAAAYLVRSWWDALAPRGRCAVCRGPMIDAKTYAGDRCAACLVCGHEVEPGCFSDLVSWVPLADERQRRAA